jgi:HAD superfamily hydrolase (TIGR01509 family)
MLVRVFGPNRFASAEEMKAIIIEKEKKYQEAFRPHLKLIDGLDKFLAKAHQRKIGMAVGSAAMMFNIDYVLDGLNIRNYFPVTISADEVQESKPHPETFLKCAEGLGMKPADCVVFEDNPKGVKSALDGGMPTVVILTMHEKHEFEGLPNILKFIKDYNDPFLDELLTSGK